MGPSLTEKLVDCLVGFCTKRYAITADISKAFLRVGIDPLDRDYLQFLWINDLDNPQDITTYRFKVVPFGSTSSPFLLQGTLFKHFSSIESEYRETLLKAFYVDNFMTTIDEHEHLYKIHEKNVKNLHEAGMPLQLWNSNSTEFNDFVGDPERERVTKVLSLKWDTDRDSLSLTQVNICAREQVTKRQCLSDLSSLYDPLGLFSPIIFKGKILMRDIWKLKVGWDEKLPREYCDRLMKLLLSIIYYTPYLFPVKA